MSRSAIFTALLAVLCFQGQAKGVLITHTFGFPNTTAADVPIVSPLTFTATSAVTGADADFVFSLSIFPAMGTAVARLGTGGLGIDSAGDTFSTIDAVGEDLTFVLSVSVINATSGNITPTDLTFTQAKVAAAANASDSGSFGAFGATVGIAGPGAPDTGPPTIYTWTDGRTTDFAGMTGDPGPGPTTGNATFDLFRMNGANLEQFTHYYVNASPQNSFLFNSISVSVVAAPEPSSWMLGLLAAFLIVFRMGWKRIRPVVNPTSMIA